MEKHAHKDGVKTNKRYIRNKKIARCHCIPKDIAKLIFDSDTIYLFMNNFIHIYLDNCIHEIWQGSGVTKEFCNKDIDYSMMETFEKIKNKHYGSISEEKNGIIDRSNKYSFYTIINLGNGRYRFTKQTYYEDEFENKLYLLE